MKKLIDKALGRGIYEGDLRYGRAFGNQIKHHNDYPADRINGEATNKPIVGLQLVEPVDVSLFKRDPKVKVMKKSLDNSQHSVNYIIQSYGHFINHMKANISLRVGKTKL